MSYYKLKYLIYLFEYESKCDPKSTIGEFRQWLKDNSWTRFLIEHDGCIDVPEEVHQ